MNLTELMLELMSGKRRRRNHSTKCRDCEYYLRVKKGNWNEPDWKSNAAICTEPNFLFCDYRYNLIGPKNFFKLKQSSVNLVIINMINEHQHFIAQWIEESGASHIIINMINEHQDFIAHWKRMSFSERVRAESMGG